MHFFTVFAFNVKVSQPFEAQTTDATFFVFFFVLPYTQTHSTSHPAGSNSFAVTLPWKPWRRRVGFYFSTNICQLGRKFAAADNRHLCRTAISGGPRSPQQLRLPLLMCAYAHLSISIVPANWANKWADRVIYLDNKRVSAGQFCLKQTCLSNEGRNCPLIFFCSDKIRCYLLDSFHCDSSPPQRHHPMCCWRVF